MSRHVSRIFIFTSSQSLRCYELYESHKTKKEKKVHLANWVRCFFLLKKSLRFHISKLLPSIVRNRGKLRSVPLKSARFERILSNGRNRQTNSYNNVLPVQLYKSTPICGFIGRVSRRPSRRRMAVVNHAYVGRVVHPKAREDEEHEEDWEGMRSKHDEVPTTRSERWKNRWSSRVCLSFSYPGKRGLDLLILAPDARSSARKREKRKNRN